jgi:small subunit ribosomal protein S16
MYRLAVQDAARHPSSGRVVTYVGSYNPHTKEASLDREKLDSYLKNGAQPTPRVIRLLMAEKVELPGWVKQPRTAAAKATRKPEKLRKNQPKAESSTEAPAAEAENSPESPEAQE